MPPQPEKRDAAAANALSLAGLFALTLLLYLPYATQAGWFVDDWAVYAQQKGSPSFWLGMEGCMEAIPGGRKLACLYEASEWWVLGDHRWAYHLVSIALLFAIAALVFSVARQARVALPWSLAIAALVIVFPGADSTRLWPIGSIGEYVVLLQMTSLFVALRALRRPRGWPARGLSALALLLALVAMATYEMAIPLVAMQGALYVVVFRNRRAFARWMVDLALVLAFVAYRLVLSPPGGSYVVHRTVSQTLSRARLLLEGAWETWRDLYAPHSLWAGFALIVLVAAGATIWSPALRGRLARWWLLLGAAVVAAAACAFVFITADDSYLLIGFGLNNRLNLPGTVPYVLAFVALLGLLYELVRRWSPWTVAAPLAVCLVAVVVAKHQIAVAVEHQDTWLESWSEQESALPGLRKALRDVPQTAVVLGFDTPRWERQWIPIVATTWDFQGRIEYETDVGTPFASPFDEDIACGSKGIEQLGQLVAPYRLSGQPVYFVSPVREVAVRVSSKRECEARLAAWGPVPYWGRTVTG